MPVPERPESTPDPDGIASWRAAVRWRREVERALGDVGLTLIQWLVLDAAATLVREQRDAVSQSDIGRRDIDATGASYRIYVTELGALAAEQGRARIQRVSTPRR